MAGYNRVIMVGNLTRDPELKPSGVCKLGIASNRQYKNKQSGATVQEVCFIDVDVWGPQAESCKQYLQKGRLVLVEGRLKLDSWKDNEGQARSKHVIVAERVVFLSSGGAEVSSMEGLTTENSQGKSYQAGPKAANNDEAGTTAFKDEPPFDDELPF